MYLACKVRPSENYGPSVLSLPNPSFRMSRNKFLHILQYVFGPLPLTKPRAAMVFRGSDLALYRYLH